VKKRLTAFVKNVVKTDYGSKNSGILFAERYPEEY
jgi:hypothetical protein